MRSEQKIVLKLVATLSLSMSTPDKCSVDKMSFLVLIKFSAKFAFLTIQTGEKEKKLAWINSILQNAQLSVFCHDYLALSYSIIHALVPH